MRRFLRYGEAEHPKEFKRRTGAILILRHRFLDDC